VSPNLAKLFFARPLVAALTLAAILITLLSASGCGPRRTPNLGRIFAEARELKGKRPLVVIPGILGSQLVNSRTGEVVWPSAFRSAGDGLSLPVSPDLSANKDDLVPQKIIDTLKLSRLVPEVFIYHELLHALREYGGYTEKDWANPGEDGDHDCFYVFAYDWRRDNVENARLLIHWLEDLKTRLGRPDLRFNIVAHSMGGLIARYAAEYGDADLTPGGVAPVPSWAGARHISRVLMFGTPNEGSADAFATLLEGYSITEGLRAKVHLLNRLGREEAYTSPSVFQLLPHDVAARFLDENLDPLNIDLYDPANWRKYGWSAAYDVKYRSRLNNQQHGQGEDARGLALANLDGYMKAVLDRARRFQQALDAAIQPEPPVPLLIFGGDCEETLYAPIILRDPKRDRWITLTGPRSFRSSSGRKITEKEAITAMFAPGDGRVTRRSLLASDLLNIDPRARSVKAGLPFAYAVFACDLHGELQNNKTLQDNALTALVAEVVK
jgi:pimeloyl-ACP methyl ester carboxylesterase